ncbi:MAG: hypothetical protein Q8R67_26235 [Rhodoferax sp.]|nr:hypothetical protein [Rhodoferax sp.]MDP3655173.1 hypothetical protein [Rhodoferax sp.]
MIKTRPTRTTVAIAIATGLGAGAATAQTTLDADGVQMLRPSAAGGTHLALGAQDPNSHTRFGIDYHTQATPERSGKLHFWNIKATPLRYASGGSGYTARLHLYASGGRQTSNWKTQNGFLGNPADVKNQEFTVYVRMHTLLTPAIAQATLKIRGGGHHAKDPDAGSCTMMTFGPASNPRPARFGKELTHPVYDYVTLQPQLDATLPENRWVGLKLLSWTAPHSPAQVINQLHIDTAPFDANGHPANHWRLYSAYTDVQGKSTGHYTQLADWGGWQTTLRMDGYQSMDFALPSVREVLPP